MEEHIEQHVLGCGAGLSDGQRALAMLGFYTSAAQGSGWLVDASGFMKPVLMILKSVWIVASSFPHPR